MSKKMRPTPNERGQRKSFPESTHTHTQEFKTRKLISPSAKKNPPPSIYACRKTSFKRAISDVQMLQLHSVPLLSTRAAGLIVPLVDTVTSGGSAGKAVVSGPRTLGCGTKPVSISIMFTIEDTLVDAYILSDPLNPRVVSMVPGVSAPITPLLSTTFLLVPLTTPGGLTEV